MKHTNNYHLPQWSEDDLILMQDFNDAMNDIEAGIDGAKAEAKADSDEAKAIANSAKVIANAAAVKPYVTGSYTGNGGSQAISLGFRPSFVIISGIEQTTSTGFLEFDRQFAITAGNLLREKVKLLDNGFSVHTRSTSPYYNPDVNQTGMTYDYIAFK